MEKTFSLKLTDEQKREIASALGIPVDRLALQVAYAEAVEEDAKGNDAIIASVDEKATDGKVWVVEGLAMHPLRTDGSPVFYDLSNVAGGLQGGYVYQARVAAGEARATKPNQLPQQPQAGQKSTK